MNTPDILYKYRVFNRFTLMSLANCSAWISSPVGLNDPFDCQIALREEIPSVEEFRRRLLAQGVFREITARFEGKELPEEFGAQVDHFKKYLEENMRSVGIFSLSSMSDSTTMWSHYSASLTGICIGYHAGKIFPKDELKPVFHQVKYCPTADIDFNIYSLYARYLCNRREEERVTILNEILSTKSDDWGYEKEWRLIIGATGNHHIGEQCVHSISFGMKTSVEAKMTIRNVLSDYPMVYYQMVRSGSGMTLDVEVMTRNYKFWNESPE